MLTPARIVRRAARVLAQSDLVGITVTDTGKNEDGSWWLLARQEYHGHDLAPYYRITLTIKEDE